MHWGAALAGSITDLSWDSDLFFCFTFWIGDELTPCEMHPFFFFPHDYYLVCFTCV